MSDNEEATSVKTRALVLARMVQEATEAVGTANVGLERAMEMLGLSVQQSQELADEAGEENMLALDEFEAWITATKAQKIVVSKVVLDEISAFRTLKANERLLQRTLQSEKPSTIKRGTERDTERDTKRHKSSCGGALSIREMATPEFPLGQESPRRDVILVSSNSESHVSLDSDDSDQEELNEVAVPKLTMAERIDASGVHHLRHIEMPDFVKAAYMNLESQDPWVLWIGHFRSFLPGLTAPQRQWNQRWYSFWRQYGYVVWQRYFYVGVGLYRTNPHAVR
ncbi:hypothetical protein AC1031_007906 [Aphanomyces cochlioides]|nr:hypothetical protein AC1031_007906 [Aphanomyces cochlioides]